MASIAASSLFGSAPTDIPVWTPLTNYAINKWVRDPNTNVTFQCKVAHTSTTTPPSQDPTDWTGSDVGKIGMLFPLSYGQDTDDGTLVMATGRNVSRTKYVRLYNQMVPSVPLVATTSGSTTLSVPADSNTIVQVGDTVEMAGLPAGTKVVSKGANTTVAGTLYTAQNFIYFRPGVSATISYPTGVSNATYLSTGTQVTGAVSTANQTMTQGTWASGATTLAFGSTVSFPASVVVGDVISATGIPTGTQITAMTASATTASTANRTISGSTAVYMSCNANASTGGVYQGRMATGAGLVANSTVASVTLVQTPSVTAGWNVTTGSYLMPPWNATTTELLNLVANRNVSTGSAAIPYTSSTYLTSATAVEVLATRNGATTSGLARFNWQVGQTAFSTVTIGRSIGSASGAFPPGTYVSAHQAETTKASLYSYAGQPYLYEAYSTTFASTAVIGEYVTAVAAGMTQARIQGLNANVSIANCGTGPSAVNTSVYLIPGALATNAAQLVIGAVTNSTSTSASARITAVGTEFTTPVATIASGATTLMLPTGTVLSQYPVNSHLNNAATTLFASATGYVSSTTTALTDTTTSTVSGLPYAFLSTASANYAAFLQTRYVSTSDGTLASTVRITSRTASSTQAQSYTTMGTSAIYYGNITAVTAIVGQNVTLAAAGISDAQITSVVAGVTLAYAYVVSGTASLFVPAGATVPIIGQVLYAAAIATYPRVTSITPEVALTVTTTSASTTVTSVGLFTAAMVNRVVTGTGIPANSRITAYTNANTVTISSAATASGTVTATLGQVWGLSSSPTATGGIAPVLGAYVSINAPATSAASAGTTTFGAYVGLSATPATSIAVGGATFTLGPYLTMAGASLIALVDGPVIQGATVTLGTSSASASSGSVTFAVGGNYLMDTTASATSAAVTATLAAYSTTSAAATSNSTAAQTYGTAYALSGTAPTANSYSSVIYFGAVLAMGTAASSTTTGAIQFGPTATINQATTASASLVTSTFGFHAPISSPPSSVPAVGTTTDFEFGGGITLSASATATGSGSAKFYPYGAGDGSTTFGIGLDYTGRVMAAAGTASSGSVTARGLGTVTGEETHLLTSGESGLPSHTHLETAYNIIASSGSGFSGSGFSSNSGAGSFTTNTNYTTAVDASSAHNNIQPTVYGIKAWGIYAGA